jgi:signal transduction histidine kinase
MKSPSSENATIMGMKPKSQSHLMKWGIFFGASILYLLVIIFLLPVFGSPIVFLSGFFVAATGWYFGIWGGVITSIALFFINYYLITLVAGYAFTLKDQGGYAGGFIILILISVVTGKFKQNFDSQANTEKQLRSNERYLTLLNEITRTIIVSDNFNELQNKLVRDIATMLEADDCYITRWNEKTKQAIPLTTSAKMEKKYSSLVFSPEELTMTKSVIAAEHVLVAEDVSNSPYINADIARNFPSVSMLGIPLIYGEHKLGAFIVGFNTFHHFTQDEIERAEQTGTQIALALWNTQQEEQLSYRLKETQALLDIGRALSETERTGPNTVLQLIIESARELIPHTEQAVIHLLDKDEDALISQAASGFTDDRNRNPVKMQLGEGIAGQVIKQGVTINVADINTDPRFLSMGNEPAFRSLLVAPIQIKGKQIGTISVQSKDINAFTDDEADLLKALGTEAAIAIENANLLESTQMALKESNALYSINQKLVASLDPNELLQDVVELLQKNFGYYHVQIYTIEPESGNFIMHTGSGEIGKKIKEKKHSLHAGEGIVGYAAETGTSFFTNDVDQVFFFVRNPLLPNTKSELAVPVKIDGNILGVLDIQQVPPRTLDQRDIQLVSAAADQLAIALQKANLYANLQTSLQTEKNMRNQLLQNERLATMGRLLASVSHELNNPLQAIQNALFLLREETGISVQGKQDLNIVLSESERMAALIARLRATYRPAQVDDFQPIQVNDLIEDIYALIATHLRHNEISFEFYPAPNLPTIYGLADQIRQVLLNLLMNAVEAMTTSGRLTVSTQCLNETDEILLKVSDTGKGIDPAILHNIFEAFVTDKESGTGLGLTITYDIITKHRGRITAENNPQSGATFSVWLPFGKMENE